MKFHSLKKIEVNVIRAFTKEQTSSVIYIYISSRPIFIVYFHVPRSTEYLVQVVATLAR